jgi:hypothetical protein
VAESNSGVYLDRLIERMHLDREEVLHKPTPVPNWRDRNWPEHLIISDLRDDAVGPLLRKPVTQRVAGSWTPELCVDLLEYILSGQNAPSIIMWPGPDNLLYVVDGVHRVSVLLAWVRDSWGEGLPPGSYADEAQRREIEAAARRVRELLQERGIGRYDDYAAARARYEDLKRELGREPGAGEMDEAALSRARSARRWETDNIGLPILWLRGDYAQAEAAVLRYQQEFARLRVEHNDVYDTPEFQSAHDQLLEELAAGSQA